MIQTKEKLEEEIILLKSQLWDNAMACTEKSDNIQLHIHEKCNMQDNLRRKDRTIERLRDQITRFKLNYALEFHREFNICIASEPRVPNGTQRHIREMLLQEEVTELADAMAAGNLTEILDALCDIRIVLDGTVLVCGMQSIYQEALVEVNRSNMTKLGNVPGEGKIQKGPDFESPDFSEILP